MIANLPPYPAYKPAGLVWLADMPAHWDVVRISRIASDGKNSFTDGDWIEVPYITDSGVRLIQTGNVGIGKYREQGFRYIDPVSFDELNCTEVYPGDILICRLADPVGRACLAPKLGIRMITSVDVCILKPSEKFSAKYVVYLLSANGYLDFVKSIARGSTRSRISRSMLGAIKIPSPPLPEQRAIARYLDHVDRRIQRYIEAKEKSIALLQEARRVATIEAMKSFSSTSKRLVAVTEIVERPIRRASDETYTPIGLYNRGRGIFRKEPRGGDELGDSDFFWIEEGDLIISGQFAWEGAIALAGSVEHGCVASHRFPILRGKIGVAETGFLLAFFQTDWGQLILDHNSRGAAGRNRPLNVRTLLKEKISLPPIGAQQRIVEMLQLESRVRQQATAFKDLLNEYRASLIAHVVTGKVDVRAAAASLSPEPAEQEPVGRSPVS